MLLFKIILSHKLHVYLVSSIHSFKYSWFVIYTTLFECNRNLIQPKTEQDLNKFYIIKLDYSSCTRGSENSTSEFTKEFSVRSFIVQLKTLTTKSTKSHIFLSLILN